MRNHSVTSGALQSFYDCKDLSKASLDGKLQKTKNLESSLIVSKGIGIAIFSILELLGRTLLLTIVIVPPFCLTLVHDGARTYLIGGVSDTAKSCKVAFQALRSPIQPPKRPPAPLPLKKGAIVPPYTPHEGHAASVGTPEVETVSTASRGEDRNIHLQTLGWKPYDPDRTDYINTQIYSVEEAGYIDISTIPNKFLFVTPNNGVVDIRFVTYKLTNFGHTYVQHKHPNSTETTNENLIDSREKGLALAGLETQVTGNDSAKVYIKHIEDAVAFLQSTECKEKVVTFPQASIMQYVKYAPELRTKFNQSLQELQQIKHTPLKKGTIRQLSLLSNRLQQFGYGRGGTIANLKSATLNEFSAYLRHLLNNDPDEFLRLVNLPILCYDTMMRQQSPFNEIHRPRDIPYPDKYPKFGITGMLRNTQQGLVCVNDAFMPTITVLFRHLFLAIPSDEKAFYDERYES